MSLRCKRASKLSLRALSLILLACAAPAAQAQDTAAGFDRAAQAAPEGILILNQDRLFSASLYGQRVQEELTTVSQALATENREIEATLSEEELQLTEERENLPRDEFMVLAAEFDQRVTSIRSAQDAKGRALTAAADAAQRRFFELVVPILLEIVQERQAAVILDSRTVLLSAETVDITDDAIAAVDAQVGNGGPSPIIAPLMDAELEGPQPLPRPTAPEDASE